ncbi:MAG TPA: MFS transporter [Tepidisphaeraceae bacterium]|jgi:MFS family permease|nr:MFS transporter [Tepidisphaeraceae bacterium]
MLSTPDTTLHESDRLMFAKIASRLLPFLFILYLISYLDRTNLSFASIPMTADLKSAGFNDWVFGFGSGIFFLGYALFEIPSNLILERVGARVWMCRIMLTWGVISACMMFVRGPNSFYGLRFLLGLAEAGFFPGMILYLTYWFPAARRARAVAMFMTATALSGVFGGPLSGLILRYLSGKAHLPGWQWLFLAEGIPAIALGFVVLWILPNGPKDAHWLSPAERARLNELLIADRPAAGSGHSHSLSRAILDLRVWLLTFVYFCISVGLYCVTFWLPKIINQAWPGHAAWQVSFMSAIPYGAAAIAMVCVGLHSDHTGERRWHAVLSLLAGAGGAVAAAFFAHTPLMSLIALSVTAMGIWSAFGPFWSMPSAFLGGTAAAGGIALINSLGCLGGWVGPAMVGWLKSANGNFSAGLWMIATVLAAGAVGAYFVRLGKPARLTPVLRYSEEPGRPR